MSETRRLKVWRIRLLMFLAVIGPGFITANVDNDAGGIYTYSAAGAQFGYLLLWVMIPMTVALVVVQEMSARMGAATGKGLSDLIREEYGLRITFFMMLGLVITNFGNVVAEFAGVASSLELFHISRYVSVPVAARGGVVAGGQRHLQERGESFPGGVVFLLRLHHCRGAGGSELEGSLRRHLQAAAQRGLPPVGIHLHGHRRGGDHDRSVDAVLPAVVDRREGNHAARVSRLALGCDPGMPLHRSGRLVHRGGLCRDALRAWRTADPRWRRCRAGAAPSGGRVCLHSLCRGAVQRFALRRLHFAHLDRLHGVRRTGLRVRCRTWKRKPRSSSSPRILPMPRRCAIGA